MKHLDSILKESLLDDEDILTKNVDNTVEWDRHFKTAYYANKTLKDVEKIIKSKKLPNISKSKRYHCNKWMIGYFYGSYANLLYITNGNDIYREVYIHNIGDKKVDLTSCRNIKSRIEQLTIMVELPTELEWLKDILLSKPLTISESLLDNDISSQFNPEDIERVLLWKDLCGTRQKHTQTITALRYYISTEKRYKNIKLPLSSQRGRRVDVDPNKYYIKFTVNREGESILMGLAYGDEPMYTWDVPVAGNYTCNPTRFVSLTTSKIKKDLSHNGKDVLYELPDELVWLYEKLKKEVGK